MKLDQVNRINEFRQLKKTIRGSDEHLIVGIDIAKNKHIAFFGTANGNVLLKRLAFDNCLDGFNKMIFRAESFQAQEGLSAVVYGVEPTANYHKPLADFLVKHGRTVVFVSANAVKKNRELLDGRWDKNDTKDAANIADLMSQSKFLYYDYPSEQVRELRNFLSFKRKLKKQDHSTRMRIRNHLIAQFYPEFDRHFGKCEKENLAIVKWCLDPGVIANMDFNTFFQIVTTTDRGEAQRRRLTAIWQEASKSIGCKFGASAKFEAKMLVETLRHIRQVISETNEQIENLCQSFSEYEYIRSIPGFGPVIGAMTIGALGDPFRFNSGKQVLKLVGLDLSASRSGKKSENMPASISKKGKAELRYALYQSAMVASTRNEHFIEYFTNTLRGREREKGIKTKMRVKLSAKMLRIAWTLMKKKEHFDPTCLKGS